MGKMDPAFHAWQRKVGQRTHDKVFKTLNRPGAGSDVPFKPDGGADKSPAHHLAASYKMQLKKMKRDAQNRRKK